MPTIFKNIRRKLAEQNKATAYFRYAIGEILLVVIGILIALQVNNWNTQRKKNNFELTTLREMDKALTEDSVIVAKFFEPRIEEQENAVTKLLKVIGNKEHISREDFTKLYEESQIRFAYRYNKGPYETLKSKGLDIISNDSLRSLISKTYEVRLPAFKLFIDIVQSEDIRLEDNLESRFLIYGVKKNANGKWFVSPSVDLEKIYTNQAFLEILSNTEQEARNARSRINSIKKISSYLHARIRAELKRRGAKHESF